MVKRTECILSDFFLWSYEGFARAFWKDIDARVGCVILVSEEHDDVPGFKQSVPSD